MHKKNQAPFESNTFYHVYNHANGSELLFKEDDNYHFFLKRYKKYVFPLVDTYAFCLMNNHFHIMLETADISGEQISKAFANLFNSYTKAINKRYNRMGSLFVPNVKRKPIESEEYKQRCLAYIHNNPVHHKVATKSVGWCYSSFDEIMSGESDIVSVDKAIALFGSFDNFVAKHDQWKNLRSSFD